MPQRLVLLSPMIGVPPFAWMARVISALGPVPAFEKARWLDVYPEYNPFKYTSFAANAGLQTWRLTRTLQAQVARVAADGRAAQLPPLLTFHSLVDSTVSTPAVVHALYDVAADERKRRRLGRAPIGVGRGRRLRLFKRKIEQRAHRPA